MKLSTKVENPPPAGGNGGGKFDSGCNFSGVTSISVECGRFHWNNKSYRSIIKRVLIAFMNPTYTEDVHYFGHAVDNTSGSNKTFTFQVDPSDTIVKVVVWANDDVANAVQFHTASGQSSVMYGTPRNESKSTTFCGEEGSQLVGIYGRFGGVLDSLGFKFALVQADVPDSIGSECTCGTEDEAASLVSFPK